MASSPLDDLPAVVKDAAYVSIGLGLIAYQRVQVRRRDLRKALATPAGPAANPLELLGSFVGERAKLIGERVGAALSR